LTLKYDLLTLKVTSLAVENDTVELTVLKTPNTDLKVIYVALQEITIAQELPKWGDLTLNYDIFDLEDDLKCS